METIMVYSASSLVQTRQSERASLVFHHHKGREASLSKWEAKQKQECLEAICTVKLISQRKVIDENSH